MADGLDSHMEPVQGNARRNGPGDGYVERPDDEIDLSKIFALLRRRWQIATVFLLAGIALGLAYAATSTRIYQATASISLDTADAADIRQRTGIEDMPLTESQVTTELELLRSEAIAEKVVENLGLQDNDLFLTSPETGLSRLRALVSEVISTVRSTVLPRPQVVPELPPSPEDLEERRFNRAVSVLRGNMTVSRVNLSRIVTIRFRALSPDLAARVANGIAEVYINDQLESKYESSERAASWLQERADQLRAEVAQLDNEIERFRLENDLVGLEGRALSDADLERIDRELADSQTELLTLQAQQRRLEEIIARGDTSAAVSATATQSITSTLRSRFLDTLRDYNTLVDRLGEDHEQVQRLQRQLDQTQELMFEEVKRAEELTRNDIEVVEERVARLEEARDIAEAELGADSEVLVELREMERNAETVRGLYTNFLQRYQQALQEQSFVVSDVRIINPAQASPGPIAPNTSRIAALGGLLGLMVAAGLVAFLEYRDNRVRTEEDVRDTLGFEFLGAITQIKSGLLPLPRAGRGRSATGNEVSLPKHLNYAVEHPLSTTAETLRGIKMAASLKMQSPGANKCGIVIGVMSCFPGEGKTTIASNFAALLASQGHKTLLIDADLRNPGLTRALVRDVETGLLEILTEGQEWTSGLVSDAKMGLDVLLARRGRAIHTSEVVSGIAMRNLLETLRQEYDYVILDMPPVAPIIDSRASLELMDGTIFVVKWGETDLKNAQAVLRRDPRVQAKSIGAVMNFFDPRKARAYGSYSSYYYYNYRYKRYYSDR